MRAERRFAEDIINLALRKGADEAEVYIRSSKNLSIEIKAQKIDALESSLSFGYSLRVIKDRRLGFSYSTDTGDIRSIGDNAVETARWADRDEYLELPDPELVSGSDSCSVDIFDPRISSIGEEEAVKKVSLLEKAAYEEDERIKNIRKARGTFSKTDITIMNSRGIDRQYSSTACTAQIMVMAEDGMDSQMGWYFAGSRFLDEVSFEDVGRNATRRAIQLLGSRRMNAQETPVVLDNLVAAEFIGVFASSLSSENVQKGKSLLSGRLGKQVISPKVSIIDSGLLSGKLGSRPVDDEGVSSRGKTLIKEGLLKGYLYNTYTAKKDGVPSTGNAVKSGFSGLPSVGISNLYIEAVSKSSVVSLGELFRVSGKCLYVTEAMGIHLVNPISGEFSIGVSGLWIEKGEIAFPVKEAVISGNILSFFENIEASGDDLRFFGNVGAPSLLFGPTDISA
ncbi:MAG: TldD/PmbA family protein [Thermodesulfovibrionales bacterium]|nr:TldD/PmbA family protein [Thermodesulfovibrionales bacterium]